MADDQPKGEGQSAKIIDLEKARREAARRRDRARDAQHDLVERMNKRFALVNEGEENRIYSEGRDPLRPGRFRLSRQKLQAFRERFMNKKLEFEIDDPKRPGHPKIIRLSYAQIWLESEQRRQCDGGPIFDPTGRVGNHYWNLWKGFAVTEQKNERGWQLLRDHVYHVLACGERHIENYLLNSAALMIQHPERRAEVAIALIGKMGAGKSIYCNALLEILGQHGLALQHQDHVRGRFNAQLHDCVMLYIGEAMWAGDRALQGYLNALITEPSITIEPKNRGIFAAPNYLHPYITANPGWVLPADVDDRRFFIQGVSDHRVGDKAYFSALGGELKNGGLSALLYHLKHRDISQFSPLDIPMTKEKRRQQLLTLDILARWWSAVLLRGYVWESKVATPTFQRWHEFCPTQLLTESFFQYCRAVSHHQSGREAHLSQFLGERIGYRHSEKGPRGHDWPVREIDLLFRPEGGQAAADQRQVPLPLDQQAEPGSPVVTDWREQRVVYASRPAGYHLLSLDEARAKFVDAMNGIPMPWQPLPP
jgi:hypothetical protein